MGGSTISRNKTPDPIEIIYQNEKASKLSKERAFFSGNPTPYTNVHTSRTPPLVIWPNTSASFSSYSVHATKDCFYGKINIFHPYSGKIVSRGDKNKKDGIVELYHPRKGYGLCIMMKAPVS